MKITIAITWLIAHLVGGLVPSSFGGNNDGASADAVISLHEVGNHARTNQIAAALSGDIDNYISGDAFGDTGSTYANALAKAIVALDAAGTPTADLVTRLEGQVGDDGRIHDTSTYGDYANVIGQTYAVAALQSAGSAKVGSVLAALEVQQCTDGSFPTYFDGCGSATASDSVDATAYAATLLEQSGLASDVVTKADAWLLAQQAKAGSFAGNVNSTGLAGYALGITGHKAAAVKAATWVRARQVPACKGSTMADAAGALAYDLAAEKAAIASGWSATYWKTASDQWLVGAAQALPVLQFAPKAVAPKVSVVKHAKTAVITIKNAPVASMVCAHVGSKATVVVVPNNHVVTVAVK